MKEDIARKIVEKNEDYKLREDYSGRFMFGETTFAVVVPNKEDAESLARKYNLHVDQMGLSYIIY